MMHQHSEAELPPGRMLGIHDAILGDAMVLRVEIQMLHRQVDRRPHTDDKLRRLPLRLWEGDDEYEVVEGIPMSSQRRTI